MSAEPPSTVENAAPQQAPAQEPPLPQESTEEEGNVSALKVCCFVKCQDGVGNVWRGPFVNVVYNNCPNYGRYYCPQHRWTYLGYKWDNC